MDLEIKMLLFLALKTDAFYRNIYKNTLYTVQGIFSLLLLETTEENTTDNIQHLPGLSPPGFQ